MREPRKPGFDTRQVIARFEAERQALALMDHPNIARVYEFARQKLQEQGWPVEALRFDPELVIRGLIIAALDPLWMHLVFRPPGGAIVLQVLYAIGMSFVVMAFLRHIPARVLGVGGLVLAAGVSPRW